MRKTNPKYKEWLKKQLRKSEKHRKKKNRDSFRRLLAKKNSANTVSQNNEKYVKVAAPQSFSIRDNANAVIAFFNKIISYLNKQKERNNIYFDLSNVKHVTVDAIIYLLALIKDLQYLGYTRHNFYGNLPNDSYARTFFEESGFLKYVNSHYNSYDDDNIEVFQIKTGKQFDSNVLIQACDFVCEKTGLSILNTKFLYVILSEMMLNTIQHAYSSSQGGLNRWYLSIKNDDQKLSFTFVDIGAGIPSTAKKRFLESVYSSDANILSSAFDGKYLRTQTNKTYRGKGLPKIKKCIQNHNLNNMYVISNKGYCQLTNNGDIVSLATDLTESLFGTIYYWEMDIKGVKYD